MFHVISAGDIKESVFGHQIPLPMPGIFPCLCELHKASITKHFVVLRYATVHYQKVLCGNSQMCLGLTRCLKQNVAQQPDKTKWWRLT